MSKEKKPHKHADLIKAWADGAEIQYLTLHGEWTTVEEFSPFWSEGTEYRIKPEPVKTVGYRRYIRKSDVSGACYVETQTEYSLCTNQEKDEGFVRWIDTKWQYHDV